MHATQDLEIIEVLTYKRIDKVNVLYYIHNRILYAILSKIKLYIIEYYSAFCDPKDETGGYFAT
jgi:hypothetical protein